MKKILSLAMVAAMLCLLLAACGETTATTESTDAETTEEATDAKETTETKEDTGKPTYDVLNIFTFSVGDVYQEYGHYHVKIVCTNNGDVTVASVNPTVTFMDKDNNILYTTYPGHDKGLSGGQSVTVEALCSEDEFPIESIGSVTVDSYVYEMPTKDQYGYNVYDVNTITKTVYPSYFSELDQIS